MRPQSGKRMSGIFAAVLVLVFSQLPFVPSSSGALCNWPAASGKGGSFKGSGMTLSGIGITVSGLSHNDGIFGDATLTKRNIADTGWSLAASVSDFSANTKTHILQWQVESTNFPGGSGTRTGATSNTGGGRKDKMTLVATFAPIPDAAWLFTYGVLALFVLRRRRLTA